MNLRPLHDRVLVRRMEETAGTSLLVVPDIARPQSKKGVVVAAGNGRWLKDGVTRVPVAVKPGDVVYFGRFTDWESAQGGEYVLIQEGDIVGICEEVA